MIVDYRKKSEYIPSWPRRIIEKFMVFANSRIAFFMKNNYDVWIFRNQLNIWENALYSNQMLWHSELWLDWYTHFTSPIRRYPDNIVQRVLLWIWNHQNNEIADLCDFINHRVKEIKDELIIKNTNDKIIKSRRKIKRVKKWEDRINFSHMDYRQFKLNLIHLARSEYHDKQFKWQFLEELKKRYSTNYHNLHKNLLLYLFLIWDRDFKETTHEILLSTWINNTSIWTIILDFFEVDEEYVDDDNGFLYLLYSIRFKGKHRVLYQKKIFIEQEKWVKNNLYQKKKRFVAEAVLNGWIVVKLKDAKRLVE